MTRCFNSKNFPLFPNPYLMNPTNITDLGWHSSLLEMCLMWFKNRRILSLFSWSNKYKKNTISRTMCALRIELFGLIMQKQFTWICLFSKIIPFIYTDNGIQFRMIFIWILNGIVLSYSFMNFSNNGLTGNVTDVVRLWYVNYYCDTLIGQFCVNLHCALHTAHPTLLSMGTDIFDLWESQTSDRSFGF